MIGAAATIHVVDDDPAVRDSLCWLLEGEGLACDVYDSAAALLAAWSADWCGCITVDVRMPGMDGLAMQEALNERGNRLPVIIVTGHADVPMAIRAMKAGAYDFIEKPYADDVLLGSLRRALAADRDRLAAAGFRETLWQRYARITPREREVMALVSGGLSNKQVAAELAVSEKTVEAHRAHVMEKMGADSLSALVRMAVMLES